MTKFNHCPNCGKKPGGFFGGSHMDLHECRKCGKLYCHMCGDRCPDCGSKERDTAGRCWA